MKSILVLAAVLSLLLAPGCSSKNTTDPNSSRTVISGKIEGGDGEMLFINKINRRKVGEIFDTIMIGEGGVFSHQVNAPLKMDYYVLTNNKRNQVFLITDSTENVTLNANYNTLNKPSEITGSPNTSVYHELFDIVSTHKKNVLGIENKIKKAKKLDEKLVLGKEKQTIKKQFKSDLHGYITGNSSSPGIAAFFDALDFTTEMELSSTIINNLAKTVPYSNYYKAREASVKDFNQRNRSSAQSSDVGKVAPNIELNDPDGVKKTLNELRGKVVLIDFWASWCGPCRRENPNVVSAYKKYNEAGFEVFSVSLDSDRSKWLAAIEKDGLVWDYHVSDLKKWATPYKDIYKFSGIPHTVLVDRDGNIIQTKIRGGALEDKLESIFGY
jgi:thiol-disulfide isomerase/thioredoxin